MTDIDKFLDMNIFEGKHFDIIAQEMKWQYDYVRELDSNSKGQRRAIAVVIKKCTSERQKGFGSKRAFYDWYLTQPKQCHYCESREEDLLKMFQQKIFDPKKTAWKNGTLQIEKKDPSLGYNPDNCVLTCVHCNNAKSDIISYDDWKEFFNAPMKQFLASKLKEIK